MTEVRKTYPIVQLKAGPQETGTVEAIVSVFGNVDLVGDRVVPGAFAKSIAEWKDKNSKGRWLPFTDSHDWSREGRVGKVTDMAETDEGLLVRAKLFMDQQSAKDIYTQIKEGVLSEFSFAYDVKKERRAKDGANELVELDVLDAAAAVYGANSETRLVSIKSPDTKTEGEPDGVKVGRVLSAKSEQKIRDAITALEGVLSQVSTQEDGKTETSEVQTKTEEPEAKSADEEPEANVEDDEEVRLRAELARLRAS
jgi:HK97 family phage prohead protease